MSRAKDPIEDDVSPRATSARDASALAVDVVHGAPALITYVDRDQQFLFANQTHERWFDLPTRRIVGRHVTEVLDSDSCLRTRPALLKALGGEAATFEGELFGGEGRRYMHGRFEPDLDDDGEVRGVFVVFTDITARHELEVRLRDSEQRFAQAFHHAAIGMALILPNGHFHQVNAALCTMLGYCEDQLLGTFWQNLTHPDDVAGNTALAAQILAGKREAFHTEKRYVHRDGHIVYALLSVSHVRNDADEVNYLVAQMQDITQRKHFEDALFRERQLAEVTLNSIGDAVLTTDIALNVTSLNPIAEAMTGWSHSEAKGHPLDDIFRLRDADSGQFVENPLHHAIQRNVIVDLPRKTRLLHRNGFETPIEDSAAPIHDHAGHVIGGVLVCRDVSENRTLALKMIHLTQHDTLTGLPNRSLLRARIEEAIALATQRQQLCALLYLDIDHFRRINETQGYSVGDRVLQAVAAQIRSALRDNDDLVFRYSGDEFIVLLPSVGDADEAEHFAKNLLSLFAQTTVPGLPTIELGVSIGITLFPNDGGDPESMVRNADAAMYEVKIQGRYGYRFYTPQMTERNAARQRIEKALRHASSQDELCLQYQPKVDATSGRIIGAEALLRMQIDGRDVFEPDQFIPVAEDSGLIISIGNWVLREACFQARVWQQRDLPMPIAVNVSPLQFEHESFYQQLDDILRETGLDPALLELEMTERMMMSGGATTNDLLNRIRARGVRLSLDDFGTGYCSLSYLKHFPVDALKIDRAFVRDITLDADTAAITTAIIAMARSLNKEVIAEGVETLEQCTFLRDAGCSKLQGFLFGAAMTAELFEQRMVAQNS